MWTVTKRCKINTKSFFFFFPSLTDLQWTRVGIDIAGTFGRPQTDKGEESLEVKEKKSFSGIIIRGKIA